MTEHQFDALVEFIGESIKISMKLEGREYDKKFVEERKNEMIVAVKKAKDALVTDEITDERPAEAE